MSLSLTSDDYSVEYLGCWKDSDTDRAISALEDETLKDTYWERTGAYKKCFEAAVKFGTACFIS